MRYLQDCRRVYMSCVIQLRTIVHATSRKAISCLPSGTKNTTAASASSCATRAIVNHTLTCSIFRYSCNGIWTIQLIINNHENNAHKGNHHDINGFELYEGNKYANNVVIPKMIHTLAILLRTNFE